MGMMVEKFDNRQNVIIRLVERGENFILGHGDGLRAADATLDLDQAQMTAARVAAFDVIAKMLQLAISWVAAESALNLHHNRAGRRGRGLRIRRRRGARRRLAAHAGKQSDRYHHQPAEHHRRQG